MKGTKLFRKFLSAFLGFVLLPFSIVLIALLVYTNDLQLQNDLAQNENLAVQTVNSVRQQADLAESMCEAVIQNQSLVSFLDKQYETQTDLLYYGTTIRDFVKVTNGVSDIKLRIYMENDSIPMGFGIFYPIDYIAKAKAFLHFYDSPETESIWLDGTFDAELPLNQRMGEDNSYHYFRKIYFGTRLIGAIEAVVPQKVFEATDTLSDTVLDPLVMPGICLYNYTGAPLGEGELASFTSAASGHNDQYAFSFTELPDAPFDVIVVSPRSRLTLLTITLALLFPLFFAAMVAAFFAYNRRTFRDIHACLDGMEFALAHKFELPQHQIDQRLRSISQRNDEISTLANRIRYLLQQIRKLLDERVRQQTAAKEAALLALQHQINPHFLYNTMEVFSSRMELAGLYEESDAIAAFCRMLRYNINTRDLTTTFRDEIQQVEYYLSIQKVRGIPFEVTFHVPDDLLEARSIRFLLEPFVENSFKYRGSACPLRICVTARDLGDGEIEIVVQNNGTPLSPERIADLNERFQNASPTMKTDGHHIGLNNINSRLKLFYGDQHCIHVACDEQSTTFSFSIARRPYLPEPSGEL